MSESEVPRSQTSRINAQRAARLAVKPGLLATLFVHHPRLVCLGVLTVPLAAIGAIIATNSFELAGLSDRDYLVRNDEVVQVDDSRQAARNNAFPMADDLELFLEGDGTGLGKQEVVGEREVRIFDWAVSVLWRTAGEDEDNGNILTREAVAEIKRVEDEFKRSEGYEDFCWRDTEARNCEGEVPACAPVRSLTRHPRLYGVEGEDGKICGVRDGHEVVSEENWANFLSEIAVKAQEGNGEHAIVGGIAELLGKDANATAVPRTFIAKSVFEFGAPIKGTGRVSKQSLFDDIFDSQEGKFSASISDPVKAMEISAEEGGGGRVQALAFSVIYSRTLLDQQIFLDLAFAAGSIFLVGVTMWIHTGSFYLSAATLFQVVLAFPVTFAVYRLIGQVKFFSGLQILTVFLIIGIAADDAFVFVDAWKQAAHVLGSDCDLERRMSWTYARAFKAMAVTSLTTAIAFLFTATNPIVPISSLGIWAGLLVLVQFLLVVSMYPCAVVMWHRSMRLRTISSKCRNSGQRGGGEVEYITPEDDEAAQEVSSLDESGSGDNGDDIENDGSASGAPFESSPTELSAPPPKSLLAKLFGRGVRKDPNEYRAIERFFRYRWTVWIQKLRWPLLALSLVLIGGTIFLATRLTPLTKEESFLPDDHPMQVAPALLRTAFRADEGSANENLQAVVFWGVKGVDNSGISRYDLNAVGSPVYDNSFDLKPAAAQQHMFDVCDSLARNEELLPKFSLKPPADCWIRDFETWHTGNKSASGFETYADDALLIADLISFLSWTNESAVGGAKQPYVRHLVGRSVAFSEDGLRPIYSELRFQTDVYQSEPRAVIWPVYQKWLAEVNLLTKDAPPTARRGTVTAGEGVLFAVTGKVLFDNAFRGIGVMISVAFVVLSISTANVALALLATIAIGGITCNLLGVMSVAGYEVGATESITLIIAVGVSFDFCSHIANAYTESDQTDRCGRTQDALTDLGISVLAGGVSSLLAISMLFFATILFFTRFAAIVVVVIALSLLWSLVFFIAFLLLFGPQNNFGSLQFKRIYRKVTSCFSKTPEGSSLASKSVE